MSWYRIPDPSLEIPAPPLRRHPVRNLKPAMLRELSLAGSLALALAWGLAELALLLAT